MSLEDIFITIVDQTSAKTRYDRRDSKNRRSRSNLESEMAKNMLEKSQKNDGGFSGLFDEDKQ